MPICLGGILDVDPETNFFNQGTMQASGGGILQLNGAATSNFVNTGGTIQSIGAGSQVKIVNTAAISASTLQTSGGGQILVAGGHTGQVTNVTVNGLLVADNNATLQINGDITNQVGSTILIDADLQRHVEASTAT